MKERGIYGGTKWGLISHSTSRYWGMQTVPEGDRSTFPGEGQFEFLIKIPTIATIVVRRIFVERVSSEQI